MQPSKSMIDYMMEYRLFPKTESDMHTSTPTFQSPISNTPYYSSSSTDSFSPENFPELSFRHEYRPEYRSDTPSVRRPIVGRRIVGNSEQKPIERNFDVRFESPIKHWENTPPRGTERNYMRNYELFPDSKGYEFKTPSHISPTSSSRGAERNYMRNYELFPDKKGCDFKTPSNISPTSSMSQSSPVSNFGMFTSPYLSLANSPIPMSPMNLGASTSRFPEMQQKMCSFCRKNGETPLVYMTHCVKEKRGNRNIVTCPILRSHVCSTCGVSGDNAHTITYCPVLRSSNNGVPLKSTTITLKNTRIKSNGRRRY